MASGAVIASERPLSMRGALALPTLLVVLLEAEPGDVEALSASLLGSWPEALAAAGGEAPRSMIGREGGWCALVARFERGDAARGAWLAYRGGEAWRRASAWVVCQPTVFLLPERGAGWEAGDGPWIIACATRDATVETRADRRSGRRPGMGVPARSVLPVVEGAQIWPVIGHPGRVVMVSASGDGGLEALEEGWGPLCEPLQVWR